MTVTTTAVELLQRLPMPDRRAELSAMVTEEFRRVLLMDEDEDLEPTESVFALGMSSVLLVQAQERLSTRFGVDLSSAVLFNSCTVQQVTQYLAGDVLRELFADERPALRAARPARSRLLWDDVLDRVSLDEAA
jgi:aryl carrier-like protein